MHVLRPFQKKALDALQSTGSVICIAPTGSGKSLIYELFSAQKGVRTLLVTPLVALARQQKERLAAAGVNVTLGAGKDSEPPPPERTGAWIVSPEKLRFPGNLAKLKAWRPNFLVVDECHCLWEWGEGFRPAFLDLPRLLDELKIERSLWLTATLPSEARDRLLSELPEPIHQIGSFDLPDGLRFSAPRTPWPVRADALLQWSRKQEGAGIVFVATRESTLRVSRLLEAAGFRCLPYHAGMSSEERVAAENRIAAHQVDVVISTSAFGMGMNYHHLKWAALWQAPSSLLTLAQMIGRVGRGCQGHAVVFWDDEDFRLLEWMTEGSPRRRVELARTARFLRTPGCRRHQLRSYFGAGAARLTHSCGSCDFCTATTH